MFEINYLECIIDAKVDPEAVAEAGVEAVGQLGRKDEILVPGQFKACAARSEKGEGRGMRGGDFVLNVVTVGLGDDSTVEEGIDGSVEMLAPEGKAEELDTELEVAPHHAVAEDAVFEISAEGLGAAKAFGKHGVGNQHGDALLDKEGRVAHWGTHPG